MSESQMFEDPKEKIKGEESPKTDRVKNGGLFGWISYRVASIFFGSKVHDYEIDERIMNFEPRERDSFGYLLSPNQKVEERQKQKRLIKASDKLLDNAWTVEIIAACIGIAVAIATGYSIHYDASNTMLSGGSTLLDKEGVSVWVNIALGSLPFVMVAIVELTKIPLARVVYNAESLLKTVVFSIVLFGAIFITYETMVTGMERSIAGQLSQISNLYLEKNNLEKLNDGAAETKKTKAHYKQQQIDAAKNELIAEKLRVKGLEVNKADQTFAIETQAANDAKAAYDQLVVDRDKKRTELREADVSRIVFLTESNNANNLSSESEQITLRIQYKDTGNDATKQHDAKKAAQRTIIATLETKLATRDKEISTLNYEADKKREIELSNITSNLDQKNIEIAILRPQVTGFFSPLEDQLKALEKDIATLTKKRDNAGSATIISIETDAQYQGITTDLNSAITKLTELIGSVPESNNNELNTKLNGISTKYKDLNEKNNLEIGKINKGAETKLANSTALQQFDADIQAAKIYLKTAQDSLIDAQTTGRDRQAVVTKKLNKSIDVIQAEISANIIALTQEKQDIEAGSMLDDILTTKKEIQQIDKRINEKAATINMYRISYGFYSGPEKVSKRFSKEELKDMTEDEREAHSVAYSVARAKYMASTESGAIRYSDVPPKYVLYIAGLWFGSLALVVSIVGTILAFGSFLLRDYHTRQRSGIAEDLKCIWSFITGEGNCRGGNQDYEISAHRPQRPNTRGANFDENVQYIREAVFIPYLTTDPSIVNAPFQTAESSIKVRLKKQRF